MYCPELTKKSPQKTETEKDRRLFFVSDIHLPLSRSGNEAETPFIDFLDHLESRAGSLYILGDLFDFWFEWHRVIPACYFQVLCRLRALRASGTRIVMVAGNHDFALGPFLKDEIGIECHEDELSFEAGGKRFFCAHGDGWNKADRGYRILKRILRLPLNQALFRNLVSADLGLWLAEKVSRAGRRHQKPRSQEWQDEVFSKALGKFASGYDCVLFGHLHSAERRSSGDCVYINCGSWLERPSYAVFDGQDLLLHSWPQSGQAGFRA